MKKTFLVISMVVTGMLTTFAGGILTNTNQSAQFVRMLSRNASTQIDAVYFNPAGLMMLDNGFYLALHNQTIKQTRTITTTRTLNNKEFIGDVSAPLFPSAFAVYKMENIAFSFGFGPNGGGGSATFDKGLPSFEAKVANPLLENFPGYAVDIAFEAQSVFYGLQLGVSWKMGDVLSGYAGARYLPSVNTYTGSIKNISVMINNQPVLASPYFTLAATAAQGASGQVQQLITAGAGSYTIAQVQNAGYISSATRAQLEGGLQSLGLTSAQIAALNMTAVKGAFDAGVTKLTDAANDTKDIEVDTKATGAGFTPIIGLNINPMEGLNIGLKYEHKTKLTLKNDTKKSDAGLDFLKDDEEVSSDIPGIITAGVGYRFSEKFQASVSFNDYLDKGVDWLTNIYGEKREIDRNYWELALGLQYNILDNFALSAGVMRSTTGVSEQYQSDFSYSNSSMTFAGGFQWNITERLTFDVGALYTAYEDFEKKFTNFSETYDKENVVFAFGLGYKF